MLVRTFVMLGLVAMLGSPPLLAQTCSGGGNGGMDAQGCDCNDPDVLAVFAAARPIPPPVVARAPDEGGTRVAQVHDRRRHRVVARLSAADPSRWNARGPGGGPPAASR